MATEQATDTIRASKKPPSRWPSLLARFCLGTGLIAAMAFGGAWLMHASIDDERTAIGDTARHELLGSVKNWGYQLQGLNLQAASKSAFDLLVIDEDISGRGQSPLAGDTRRALATLKRKPDGGRRLVLAYLSIGEAEDYRGYWDRTWVTTTVVRSAQAASQTAVPKLSEAPAQVTGSVTLTPHDTLRSDTRAPSWLGSENPDWPGNYHVRFWDPAWQTLILGRETSAIDRIVAAGFDGIYLDRADVYQDWTSERPTAKQDMTAFIMRISERVRAQSPGFIVVMQNAEELLGQHQVRQSLDAVAKEDLLYGVTGNEAPNSNDDIDASVTLLKKAQKSGLPVLAVEYLDDRGRIAEARTRLEGLGFIPYFASRQLDRLSISD